jgi:hypothetical protein
VSRYQIQYAPPADQARHTMPRALRTAFDAGMQRLAADPYGHDSTPVKDGADRRPRAARASCVDVSMGRYAAGAAGLASRTTGHPVRVSAFR